MHDSVAFDGLYDRMTEKHPEIKAVVMDAGFKTPWICKKVFDDNRVPVLPYKRPMGKAGFFRPYSYVLDEFYDCVICPENHILNYATTNREGYREFKSKGYSCALCPSIEHCTESAKHEKLVTKHIWEEYVERSEIFAIHLNTKLFMKKEKKPLSECLRTQKKNTLCVIQISEAYLRSQTGLGLNLLL